MKTLSIAAAAAAFLAAEPAAAIGIFAFDDGTNQGWEARVGTLDGAELSLGPAGFIDINNFPVLLTDPIDGDGSAVTSQLTPIPPAGGGFLFSLISPDLSADPDWQNLTAFEGQVAASFTGLDTYTSSARLVIEDTTGGGSTTRVFSTAEAPLPFSAYTEIGFSGIDTFLAGQGVDSYTTEGVIFNVFQRAGALGFNDIERVFVLDNVSATSAGDPGPGTPDVPLPAPIFLLGAAVAALGAKARRRT